jgi:hypothetical protein
MESSNNNRQGQSSNALLESGRQPFKSPFFDNKKCKNDKTREVLQELTEREKMITVEKYLKVLSTRWMEEYE